MSSKLGVGLSCFKRDGMVGLDPYFKTISGHRLVIESVCSRWLQPQGSLVWAPTIGRDIRGLLGARIDDALLRAVASSLESEAENDDRVDTCEVDLVMLAGNKIKLTATIALRDSDSYEFVLTVDKYKQSLSISK